MSWDLQGSARAEGPEQATCQQSEARDIVEFVLYGMQTQRVIGRAPGPAGSRVPAAY